MVGAFPITDRPRHEMWVLQRDRARPRKTETRSKNGGTMQKCAARCNVAGRSIFVVCSSARVLRAGRFREPLTPEETAMTRTMRSVVGGLTALVVVLGATTQARALCIFNCTYTKTKYPIVLEHGLGGFD